MKVKCGGKGVKHTLDKQRCSRQKKIGASKFLVKIPKSFWYLTKQFVTTVKLSVIIPKNLNTCTSFFVLTHREYGALV